MQYTVKLDTDNKETKLITYITCNNKDEAINRVSKYNQKYPDWNMILLNRPPVSDDTLTLIEYVDC